MNRWIAAAAFAALSPLLAHAVFVNPDGNGQALIYPYYTVQSANGDAFNTYVSIVNETSDAKALRVRLRESRAGKEVASFNLYLSPHDAWAAAVVPATNGGATLVTGDVSCNSVTNGQPWSLGLSPALYSGNNDDGAGNGIDRLREGWIEVLEMARITDPNALAGLTRNAAGYPVNCGLVEPGLASGGAATAAPAGGLSGTLTLINVANGVNFAVKAEALDGLASRAFYRRANDPYPDFAAVEIDPVSVSTTTRTTWISYWTSPTDAVSAALLRQEAWGEYVLDKATASHTEMVLTFPTRSFYRNELIGTPPVPQYTLPVPGLAGWSPNCDPTAQGLIGTPVGIGYRDRESRGVDAVPPGVIGTGVPAAYSICASAAVLDVGVSGTGAPTGVLGSSRGFRRGSGVGQGENGSIVVAPYGDFRMQSLARSVRIDALTGTATIGAHVLHGLPMTGFTVRTFTNGTLHCSAGTCLGNYGGAYPLDYRRVIEPAP